MRSVLFIVAALSCGIALPGAATAAAPVSRPAVATPARISNAKLEAARQVAGKDPARALELANQAEQELRANPASDARTVALATALWLRAEAHARLDDVDAARGEVAQALKLVAELPDPLEVRADLYKTLGWLQMQSGKTADALATFQRAFAIYRPLGAARSESLVLQNIALLYSVANDNQRAAKYFRQAADTYSGDPALSLSLHNNLGNVLLQLERHPEAEREYLQALALARQTGNKLVEARIVGNIARNRVEAGQLDAADEMLSQGLRLTQDGEALQFRPQMLATAARVAFKRGDLPRAERLIDESFSGIDLTHTNVAMRDAHFYAYQIYAAAGQPNLALKHLEALKRIGDEANKVAASAGAALMAAQFDFANQEARIANLRAEEATRRARSQQILFVSIGGAALAILILLTIGVFTLRRSRDQVRAANADLAQTNVALEKALKARTEFLATTSHEIRTPLNGILGMTQVMLADASLPPAARDRIGVVHGAGVTMRALVDDLLDVAKMETGNLTVDAAPMDLPATLREVTRMWDEQARAKGLTFRLDLDAAPAWIVSDVGRLRQIVFNLLSNAIKFTEYGCVTLSVATAGQGESRRLRLTIRDTGIGIARDKCEAIFESFKQADSSTTRKYGGTGLGLTICRNLARGLGGEVEVESAEGAGSTFVIDLPLVLAEAPAPVEARTPNAAILFLERNPIARSMLRTLVEGRGAAASFAATPEEALGLLGGQAFDRLVADEATVRAFGDDFAATLAAVAGAAHQRSVPVLLLWTKFDQALQATLTGAGADQLLEKPINATRLIECLFPEAEENSRSNVSAPLVSSAA